MEIYPALDILDGQCVRLRKGNFKNKTVYSDNPKNIVRLIQISGAKNLHLVDLSGAKDPSQRQTSLIQQIISSSDLKIQYGGGIRSLQEIQDLLRLGVDRVVLGSLTIRDPSLTLSIMKEIGAERITLALDIRTDPDGNMKIATEGWNKTSSQNIFDWIRFYAEGGLERILCTDISRDGTMKGPNLDLYQSLVKKFPQIQFQASGGVSSLEDLKALKKIGVHSAVIGKALYQGKISLPEALLQC